MKSNGYFNIALVIALIAASAVVYLAQIAIFRRTVDTFFYMVQDFAFLPVQVLLVTLVINDLLKRREKAALQHKMNMVIGAFFVESGEELLVKFAEFDAQTPDIRDALRIRGDWTDRDFAAARSRLRDHPYEMDARRGNLAELKEYLLAKREAVFLMLANPNLLEHETFTDLLWAVSHVTEELARRKDLTELPESDLRHIAADVRRAYERLLSEWLTYVLHLKRAYPFMYSLVVRTNPFDTAASPIVTE